MVPTSGEYSGTPDEYGLIYPWKIMVLPLKIFTSKAFHIYIYIYIFFLFFFYSTPKKILGLCN